MLGISLGIWLDINMTLAAVMGCLIIAIFLSTLQNQRSLSTDTLLGILSHTSLSIGLIAISMFDNVRIDLMALLFGDILSVNLIDLYWIIGSATVIIFALLLLWRPLLSITIHEELAFVEGLPVQRLRLLLTILIAIVIALSMKVVGVLLITALLIIPSAAARNIALSPEQMAILSSVIGAIAVITGLACSYFFDSPAGPSIVLACSLIFTMTLMYRQITRRDA